MDPFLIFLIIVISLLTLIVIAVGIQIMLLLRNLNKTLSRANTTFDAVQMLIDNLHNPLSDPKRLSAGVKAGLTVAEEVIAWVKKRKGKSGS